MPKSKRIRYLKESKNGWYSYHRRIPEGIKHLPEFANNTTFYKKSFETKDLTLATLEVEKLNGWFDSLQQKSRKPKTTKEAVRRAKDALRIEGLLPMQLDTTDKKAKAEFVQSGRVAEEYEDAHRIIYVGGSWETLEGNRQPTMK